MYAQLHNMGLPNRAYLCTLQRGACYETSAQPCVPLQTRHKYGEKRINLLRACLRRELILLGRQRFLYIFRTGQARLWLRCP